MVKRGNKIRLLAGERTREKSADSFIRLMVVIKFNHLRFYVIALTKPCQESKQPAIGGVVFGGRYRI